MLNYFSISELCITNAPVEQSVADKLLEFHIVPMNEVRGALGAAIWASGNSGYRPKSYEVLRGRNPKDSDRRSWSRHTFTELEIKDPEGKGAVDWTTRDEFLADLGRLLFEMAPYSRVCWYPQDKFYHSDYGYEERGKTLFVNEGGWVEKNKREWLQLIQQG